MSLNLLKDKGTPLERQVFTWRDLVSKPISKLNVDAFTRVRTILMNGIEHEAVSFSHACARMNRDLRGPLARIRQLEQHQQILVNWLLPSDLSPLETTIAYEQTAIEVTAGVAQGEPDQELDQTYRFGLLEDLDHLYRYSALLDRLEGKDANNILQSYTDIVPGRSASEEHRASSDNIRRPYDRRSTELLSKLHALTIMSGEQQALNYYMNIGPLFADPLARQLYAEIASLEEQHVTQYESLLDPEESWLEKWVLHEACEAYNYWSCLQSETEPRLKAIWERMLEYELGHLQAVCEVFKSVAQRDPAEILPTSLSQPIDYRSHRDFVRKVLNQEVNLRAKGFDYVPLEEDSKASIEYRRQVNAFGSPSEKIAQGYQWIPGGELVLEKPVSQGGLI